MDRSVEEFIKELERKARDAYQHWRACAALETKARRAYQRAQTRLLMARNISEKN